MADSSDDEFYDAPEAIPEEAPKILINEDKPQWLLPVP
jgi:hypothetical protein